MLINDLLREIWRDDYYLQEQIPATDDFRTNRFFEHGIATLNSPSDLPPAFVTIEDEGDRPGRRATRRIEGRHHSYTVRVCTPRKALTETLVKTYLGHIERRLVGSVTDQGGVGYYVLESQRYQSLSGLFVWRGQFTCSVRKRRPWQTPLAQPV